jgi:hypothetical protein
VPLKSEETGKNAGFFAFFETPLRLEMGGPQYERIHPAHSSFIYLVFVFIAKGRLGASG